MYRVRMYWMFLESKKIEVKNHMSALEETGCRYSVKEHLQ